MLLIIYEKRSLTRAFAVRTQYMELEEASGKEPQALILFSGCECAFEGTQISLLL